MLKVNMLDLVIVVSIFILGPVLLFTLMCDKIKQTIKSDKDLEAVEKEHTEDSTPIEELSSYIVEQNRKLYERLFNDK